MKEFAGCLVILFIVISVWISMSRCWDSGYKRGYSEEESNTRREFVGRLKQTYYDGYKDAKRELIAEKFTINDIREAYGLPRKDDEDVD